MNGLPVPTTGAVDEVPERDDRLGPVMPRGAKRVPDGLNTFRWRAHDTAGSSPPGTSVYGLSGMSTWWPSVRGEDGGAGVVGPSTGCRC